MAITQRFRRRFFVRRDWRALLGYRGRKVVSDPALPPHVRAARGSPPRPRPRWRPAPCCGSRSAAGADRARHAGEVAPARRRARPGASRTGCASRRADESQVAPVVARERRRHECRSRARGCAWSRRRTRRAGACAISSAGASVAHDLDVGRDRGREGGVAAVDPAHVRGQRAQHLHQRAADVAVAEDEHGGTPAGTTCTSSVHASPAGAFASTAPARASSSVGRASAMAAESSAALPSEPVASIGGDDAVRGCAVRPARRA